MKEKIDCKNLFVACKVSVNDYLIEPFVQYETFGKEYHEVVIDPKRELILLEENDGKKKYTLLPTEDEIYPVEYSSSYCTNSSPYGTVCCGYVNGYFNPGIRELIENIKHSHYKKINQLGYLVPFDEYIQSVLNIKVKKVTIHQAKILLVLANLVQSKPFVLSDNEEKAKEQIETKVYRKNKSNI